MNEPIQVETAKEIKVLFDIVKDTDQQKALQLMFMYCKILDIGMPNV